MIWPSLPFRRHFRSLLRRKHKLLLSYHDTLPPNSNASHLSRHNFARRVISGLHLASPLWKVVTYPCNSTRFLSSNTKILLSGNGTILNRLWGIQCQVNHSFHHYQPICLKVGVWLACHYLLLSFRKFVCVVYDLWRHIISNFWCFTRNFSKLYSTTPTLNSYIIVSFTLIRLKFPKI